MKGYIIGRIAWSKTPVNGNSSGKRALFQGFQRVSSTSPPSRLAPGEFAACFASDESYSKLGAKHDPGNRFGGASPQTRPRHR